MNRKRWLSWAAVSSLPQAKKVSNQQQLDTNRQHAEKHGGEVVRELVVPGESRSIVLLETAAERIEAYAELRRMIERREFDVLVYLDRSRLGRKASLSMSVIELCHEAGIITYETDNPPATLDTPAGYDDALVGAIKSVGAQQEVVKLTARHKSGMIGRVQSGKMPGGAPYGYVVEYVPVGAKLEPRYHVDEAAAVIVRQVFDLYLSGNGAVIIAEAISATGAPTPAGKQEPWTRISIAHIINRVWVYAGYTQVNRNSRTGRPFIRTRGTWEVIIPDSVAVAVDAEHAARKPNRRLANTSYVLAGVCICAKCNRPMVVTFIDRPPSPRWYYVRCSRTGHVTASYQRVLEFVRGVLESLRAVDVDAMLEDDDDGREQLAAQLAQQDAAAERVRVSLRKADTAWLDGTLDDDRYRVQVDRLKAQLVTIEAEAERLQRAIDDTASRETRRERLLSVADMGASLLDGDATAANAWLRQVLRVVVHNSREVEAHWL